MTPESLGSLLEQAVAHDAADPTVGVDAWQRARRESRRSQVAAVGAVGLAAAVVVALVAIPRDDDRSVPPITNPTTSSPTTDAPLTDPHAAYVQRWQRLSQPAWEDGRVDQLPRLETALPDTIDPFGSPAPPLADDPVSTALAVAQPWGDQLAIRVLGDDGRWRAVDTSGLAAALTDFGLVSLISGHPISPDGTQLAVPQRGSVVIVDLTTAATRRVDLPQDDFPAWAGRTVQWSPDGRRLLVGTGHTADGNGSWLVDLETGAVESTPYNAIASSFAPDGSVVELRDACGFCEVRRYDGVDRVDTLLLEAELYVVRPAVGDVMAVSRAVRSWSGPKREPANSDGLLIVDPDSGDLVSFMPMRDLHQVEVADLVGWLDDRTVLFSVFVNAGDDPRDVLAAWNYETGDVSLVTDPWRDGVFRISFGNLG